MGNGINFIKKFRLNLVNIELYFALLYYIFHTTVCLFKYIRPQEFHGRISAYIRNAKTWQKNIQIYSEFQKEAKQISKYFLLKKTRDKYL